MENSIPTAVEWLANELYEKFEMKGDGILYDEILNQAKEIEKKQLFLSSNTSAKEAYKAGQTSMYCGCYEYDGCTTYEEWLYNQYKNK